MRWIALAVLVACTPAMPALPSKGGPQWIELQSDHFTVWTDASAERTAKLVRLMERLRQVVLGIAFPDAASERRTLVVAFRNDTEAHAYIPPGFGAFSFGPQNPLQQPVIVLPMDSLDTEAGRSIITHELAHVISYAVLHPQPHWFAEGLATYFETIRLDEDSGKVDVGVPRADRASWLRRRPLPVAELFACQKLSCMEGRYYATAWLLFAFLMNEHRAELLAYMKAMGDIAEGAQTALWLQMFPQLGPDALDHEMARWLRGGTTTVNHYNVKFGDYTTARRELGDADALVARGVVHAMFDQRGPLPPELADALVLDPTSLHARLIEHAKKRAMPIDVARRIAAAHGDDWRAWWLLWSAGDRDAHARTCELIARDPPSWLKKSCPPPAPTGAQ